MENAKEFQKNIYIYLCFTHYSNAYDHLDHKMVGNSWEEIGAPNHLTGLLRNLYAAQEVTDWDMEKRTGSKLGKEYNKAVYCHPDYLPSMQSTSCEMPGGMNH